METLVVNNIHLLWTIKQKVLSIQNSYCSGGKISKTSGSRIGKILDNAGIDDETLLKI
jgi:hypothetical protein